MTARRIFLAITFAVMFIASTAVARAQSGAPEQSTQYPPEIVAKVHPNLKFVDLAAQTGAVVKQVRIELLTLVDHVQ